MSSVSKTASSLSYLLPYSITARPTTVTTTITVTSTDVPLSKRSESPAEPAFTAWGDIDTSDDVETVTVTNTKTFCPSCYAGTELPAHTWSAWESSGLSEPTATTIPLVSAPSHGSGDKFSYFTSQDSSFVSTVCACVVTQTTTTVTVTPTYFANATVTVTDTVTTTATPAPCSTDLSSDKFNCGACGNKCAAGLGCFSGVCKQPNPCTFEGQIEYCYPDSDCVCYETTEGKGFCADGDGACGPECLTSDDCSGNNVCLTAETVGCGDAVNTCSTDSDLSVCPNPTLGTKLFARKRSEGTNGRSDRKRPAAIA